MEFLAVEIQPFLKSKGYRRRTQTFHKWVGRNCEVVNFQGSKWSTRERYDFFVNLGVFNRRIFEFENDSSRPREPPKFPSEAACHWRRRLGELLPTRLPKDWSIRVGDSLADLGTEIRSGLDVYALPLMDQIVTDEGLRDSLLGIRELEIEALPQLIELAALLAEIGPENEFERVLEACRRDLAKKPFATLAKARVERLEEHSRAPRHKGMGARHTRL